MSKRCRAIRVSALVFLSTGLVACSGSSGGTTAADSESAGVADETSTTEETSAIATPGENTVAPPQPAPPQQPEPQPDPEPQPQPDPEPQPEPEPQPDPVSPPTPPTPPPVASIVSALEGDWTTGCFPFDRTANTQSSLLTLSISGTSSVYTAYSYSDFNCSVPAISPDTGAVIINGNEDILEFPEQSVTTSLGEASFINFTTVAATVDSMPVPAEFFEPSTWFSIYTITDDGRLFFGNGASFSEEARPLDLDVFFYYIRL